MELQYAIETEMYIFGSPGTDEPEHDVRHALIRKMRRGDYTGGCESGRRTRMSRLLPEYTIEPLAMKNHTRLAL